MTDASAPLPATPRVVWIGYTTQYRQGGPEFARAAATLRDDKRRELAVLRPGVDVVCERVDSKLQFVQAMERVRASGRSLLELHLICHSGMYGPMFRTTGMPEQFSPWEWRNLSIPFAPDGEAFFHACRTARWFAPFFARTFNVPASGFHWYTAVSSDPKRFRWVVPRRRGGGRVFVVGCKGRKSHGLVASAIKYAGLARLEELKRFVPAAPDGDPTYDGVAQLYAEVFDDIGVREIEWRWLTRHLDAAPPARRVLDVGCGNGALLRKLGGRIALGAGVDASSAMVDIAARRAAQDGHANLSFQAVTTPTLPFPDASFDVVVSLLSFRYLDWDPIMNEIRRVLAPGGRLLVVDMVTAPVRARELPLLATSRLRTLLASRKYPEFHASLRRLVADPRWHTMLRYNPIRAEHELVWYLESRFPGRRVEKLDVGLHARVLAFDSGPLQPGTVGPQTYP